jgi:hypothetical protein
MAVTEEEDMMRCVMIRTFFEFFLTLPGSPTTDMSLRAQFLQDEPQKSL